MAANRNDIINKFKDGMTPPEGDFKEIFDNFVHKYDDKATNAMIDAGIDDEHYVTPALLRVGLQNIGAITGGGNLPYKQHIDNFNESFIHLERLPIESSVKVFKNGQLLLEGEDGDYTINYETAVVTFPELVGFRNIEIDYWYKNTEPIPGNGTNYVDLTTAQSIAGKKTFDTIVIDPQNITAAPFYYEDFATGFGDFVNSPNGDAPWVWATDDGADGSTSCISSGAIGNMSNSVIELNQTTTQESTLLKYWYKTSSEVDYDYLHIEVNGVIVKRYAGTNDWTEDYVFIHGIGPQLIKFIYNKDYGLIGGQDKVWIDKVSLTNVSEDFIVNSEALFAKKTTFQDGLIGNGLSSFEDVYVRRSLRIFDDNGNQTSGIGSHNGGSVFSQYSKNKTTPLSWMQVNDDKTELFIKTFNNIELFKAASDVNFPNGFIQVHNPAARVIIGSHAYNYTDFTFAVNGNTKLDGSLDVTNSVIANSFVKTGGTSAEFLKADGSVDSNAYLPLTGGTISGSLISTTFVKSGSTSDDVLLGDGTTTSLSGLGGSGSQTLQQTVDLSNTIAIDNTGLGIDITATNGAIGISVLANSNASGIESTTTSGNPALTATTTSSTDGGYGLLAMTTNSQPAIKSNGSNTGKVFSGNNNFSETSSITKEGVVTATSFVKSGGTSSQFLKANGSVDSTAYLPLTGGTISGNLTSTTFVKSGSTSDDILLGDGTTTSLAGIAAGGSSDIWTKTGNDIQNNSVGHTQIKLQSTKQFQILNATSTVVGYIDENGVGRYGNASQYVTIGLLGGNNWLSMYRSQASMTMNLGNPQINQPFAFASTNYYGTLYQAGSGGGTGAEHSFAIGGASSDLITTGKFRISATRLLSTVPIKYDTDLVGSYDNRTLVDKGYVDSLSVLSKIDEGNGNGYRLTNADPLNFGNIGADAVDLSYSETPSDVLGATGSSAFAMGSDVIASNYFSTVFGYLIDNNGIGSFDSGFNLKDNGYTNSLFGIGHDVTSMNTTVVGQASNIISDQISDFNYTTTKKLFVVGNGTIQNADYSYAVNTRSDALVVRLNGSVEAPSLTSTLIEADTTGKTLVTKEYVGANYTKFGSTAPSSATDTGVTGEVRITSTYVYYCIATNTWVRAALATW